jgi:plastocyanin
VTLAAVGVIAAIIPILLGYFLVTGMAEQPGYTNVFSGTATSTTISSTGPGSTVVVSIPKGASNPANAPGYSPDKVTVVIGVNASVKWTNDDTFPHTVSASTAPSGAVPFKSGNLDAGKTFIYNFTTPGTYQYNCDYHAWMAGTVVVVAGSGSTGVKVSIPKGAGNPANPPGYAPEKITVVIGVNNTVTWSNDDTFPHTVSGTNLPAGASPLSSGNMDAGSKYTYAFTVPGTYHIGCDYHAWMTGTVTVVQGK